MYLRRNAGKSLPLTLVIVMAVLLIAGIVALINSIPLSIRTIYAYSQNYLGITPRGDPLQTPLLKAIVEQESPVPIDRILTVRGSEAQVASIVGDWPFAVLALQPEDFGYYLQRMGMTRLEGRLPRPGAPEAVISEPVARNRNLRLGSELIGPDQNEAYSPQSVKVVGIAHTPNWLMLTPYEYHVQHHFPPIDVLLVFAKNRADQDRLDAWAMQRFEGQRARLFAYQQLEEEADSMFKILYKILNVIIGTLVLVITFMMGMLMNIYLSQRVPEFGLLQALGYSRATIVRRVLGETALVVGVGWVLGLVAAYGLLSLVRHLLMDPQAFALDPLDRTAYLYSVPVPLAILLTGVLTVMGRFRRFDPVSVVERRLV